MSHLLALLFVCWPSLLLAQEDGALSVRIELGKEEQLQFDKPFRVVFTNESDDAIRIWYPNSEYDSDQISFEFEDVENSQKYAIHRIVRYIDGTWNFFGHIMRIKRESIVIPPHKNHVTLVTFSDDWSGLPEPNRGKNYHVTAAFRSKPSEMSDDPPIWEGTVHSKPVMTSFTTTGLITPQDWLIHGFSENAIEMMQADPKLVKSRDKEKGTPLQAAAKGKALKALRWLLENDGDWEAKRVDYREFLVDDFDPAVIELILTKNPNLDQRASNSNHSILHQAARHFAFSSDSKGKEKWQKIAKMYIEAGATYDLRSAIYLSDLSKVREILTADPSKAGQRQYGPPLRLAAKTGQLKISQYLIDNFEVDVNDIEDNGHWLNLPIVAESLKHPQIVKLLIDHGADPKARISYGSRFGKWIIENDATLLHYAARDGVPETINLLLDRGLDITATTTADATLAPHYPVFKKLPFKQTPLNLAAFFGAIENAKAMIQHSAFLKLEKSVRQRMLDEALITGAFKYSSGSFNDDNRPKLVEILIEAGANPNASIDGEKVIPPDPSRLIETVQMGRLKDAETIQLLRERGAKIDLLTAIAIRDQTEVARQLKADPKSANAQSQKGCPALHYAVICNNIELVQLLLEAGADPNAANKDPEFSEVGRTAVDLAKYLEYHEIVELLEQAAKQK